MDPGSCCDDLRTVLSPGLFKALADPTRLVLLATLARSRAERSVGELAAQCPVDVSVVSRHLSLLREAGVLAARRQGKQVYYRARCGAVAEALRRVADALDACCPPSDDGGEGENR